MTDPADTLADLRRHLQILLGQPVTGSAGTDSGEERPAVREPVGDGDEANIGPYLYAGLQFLQERDAQIQQELLRLQRTLSRQVFRGAESARRLVRRLARRAQQNITDAEAMKGRLKSGLTPEPEDLYQLCTVIEALRKEGLAQAGKAGSHGSDSPGTQSTLGD